MTIEPELHDAIAYARDHAEAGLNLRPFDPIHRHTIDQLTVIDAQIAHHGDLSGLASEQIDVGRMAARELGNDERDFAHALHVIQWYADEVTGDNRENR